MKHAILAVAFAVLGAGSAWAGAIERACNGSNRAEATPRLCACIQSAADLTLTARDQARAARFFQDPHQAQEIRQSDRQSDEAFWLRYRAFGETAEAFCAAG